MFLKIVSRCFLSSVIGMAAVNTKLSYGDCADFDTLLTFASSIICAYLPLKNFISELFIRSEPVLWLADSNVAAVYCLSSTRACTGVYWLTFR